MNKGLFYKLQLKRAFKIYPAILLITILTIAAIGVAAVFMIYESSNGEDKQKISVAIVGDIEDTHFGIGIHVLENLDSSRFFVEFPQMTEPEAIRALKEHEINGYVYIPKNFVKGVYYGDNIPARYVVLDGPAGFGTALSSEVLDVVSKIVVETQNGSYSFTELARAQKQTKNLSKKVNDMNFSYIEFILNRNTAYELEFVGVADLISLSGYFICGIITFFLLIWGISCNKLLSGRNLSLSRSLRAAGMKTSSQLFAEYLAFLAITIVTMLIFAVFVGLATANNNLGVKELADASVFGCVFFVIQIIPVIIMFTMMHKAFYELIPGTVSGIIFQFLIAVGLGYVSGCFYPNYFFPDAVRDFALCLPSGAGFLYIRKIMSNTLEIKDFLIPVVYTFIFAAITLFARKRAMGGDKK